MAEDVKVSEDEVPRKRPRIEIQTADSSSKGEEGLINDNIQNTLESGVEKATKYDGKFRLLFSHESYLPFWGIHVLFLE